MKKLIFALALVILFTACQSPKVDKAENTKASETTKPIETPSESKTPSQPTKAALISPLAKIGDIEYHEPKIIDSLLILKDKIKKTEKDYLGSLAYSFYFYEAGKIKIEPYKDWSLLILEKRCDGPCPPLYYRFAWNPQSNKTVNLTNHSYQPIKEDYEYMEEELKLLLQEKDSKTVFKSLELPDTIAIPDTDETLKLAEKDADILETTYAGEKVIFEFGKVAFTDPVLGNIYMEKSEGISCLYAVLPDGSIQRYAFDPKFFTKNTSGNTATLTDGSGKLNLQKNFHYFEMGCGVTAGCYYVLDKINEENLKLMATTGTGIKFYGVKEVKIGASRDMTELSVRDEKTVMDELFMIRGALDTKEEYENPEKLQEFADRNQILFWKDPFGRYSYIAHNDIASAAECGKPVIYLYPEKEMDVKVSVGIDQITASIPEHGSNGWSVRAHPNGKIYNYTDQQEYPYLFWEGTDEEQIEVNRGFVIARESVHSFLDESLTKLGLNKTEKTDFMEFWESRILENHQPYFYFSFLGTKDFNKIAPLAISPKPDTLIRLFMYYSPLNEALKIRPQTLRSIPRKGFTVIEWGGTSNVPWKM